MDIIKIGGALISEQGAPTLLWEAVSEMQKQAPVVLLHGGGSYATDVARRLGHTPRMIHGRRVTTDLDLEIVQWTLRGAINARLVAQARTFGIPAVGLSGIDDALIQVVKRPPRVIDNETVDFGWVGDVIGSNVEVLRLLVDAGRLPIIAPLGVDEAGLIYNVNADTVAVTVAQGLGATRLLLVAEAGSVRRNPDDPASRLAVCTKTLFETGCTDGWIVGGMRVKLTVAFQALSAGIHKVFILSPNDLLNPTQGTQVVLN